MIDKYAPPTLLKAAFEALRPTLKKVALFGVMINLLSLGPTLYMLEVYDRVVNSRDLMTLMMLTVLVLGIYALLETVEWVRGELLLKAGFMLEAQLGEKVYDAVFGASLRRVQGATQSFNDMRTLREFLSTPAVTAMLDAPMALLFLILIYLINPLLALFSLSMAIGQVYIAFLTEKLTQPHLTQANREAIGAQIYAGSTLRNAQVIESMGMLGDIHRRWMERQNRFLFQQAVASDHAGGLGAAAKLMQQLLSSGLLGFSCWLLLKGELAGGGSMLIISSILGGKILAPLVQVISSWKIVVNARDAYQRLEKLVQSVPSREAGMSLPPPGGDLNVEGVVAAAPASQIPILRGVTFALPAGKALAVFGPSAAGKSTLARLLVGIWPSMSGKVRLDGADIFVWNKAELGPHIGYLPQQIELFDGSLAENIARFGDVDRDKVEAAARAVGLHDTILQLPAGYDAQIGDDGCYLSGGQRQRVGLARAIYGSPKFVVLDEPNSSLDEAGEQALLGTLLALKAAGTTLVVITHRTSILPVVDAMLILRDGQAVAFGPRDEVLANLAKSQQSVRPAAQSSASPVPSPA